MWYNSEDAYFDRRTTLSSTTTSTLYQNITPASTCMITLLAIYNRASIDPGLTINASTLQARKLNRWYYI